MRTILHSSLSNYGSYNSHNSNGSSNSCNSNSGSGAGGLRLATHRLRVPYQRCKPPPRPWHLQGPGLALRPPSLPRQHRTAAAADSLRTTLVPAAVPTLAPAVPTLCRLLQPCPLPALVRLLGLPLFLQQLVSSKPTCRACTARDARSRRETVHHCLLLQPRFWLAPCASPYPSVIYIARSGHKQF